MKYDVGILIYTSRSGEMHGVYVDPDNDFSYLSSAIRYLVDQYISGLDLSNHKEYNDVGVELLKDVQNQMRSRDCGTLEFIKNEL